LALGGANGVFPSAYWIWHRRKLHVRADIETTARERTEGCLHTRRQLDYHGDPHLGIGFGCCAAPLAVPVTAVRLDREILPIPVNRTSTYTNDATVTDGGIHTQTRRWTGTGVTQIGVRHTARQHSGGTEKANRSW
jgi:hypothetical protein